MINQEIQLQKLRAILLDTTKPNAERVAAQKSIMKILDLKEELPEPIGFDNITKRRDTQWQQ